MVHKPCLVYERDREPTLLLSYYVELIHLVCRPHYLPRVLTVIDLISAYVPPDGNAKEAKALIEDTIDVRCLR